MKITALIPVNKCSECPRFYGPETHVTWQGTCKETRKYMYNTDEQVDIDCPFRRTD